MLAVRALFSVVTALCAACAAAESGSAPEPGTYAVESLTDWSLARGGSAHEIPLAAYWPAEAGAYPVVLFSHGAGGDLNTAPAMMRQWASHGYVVIVPTHRNDLTPHAGPGLYRAVREFQLRRNERGAMWRVRIGEIGALIDALDAGRGLPPAVHERADPDRIGLAGHSFGAYTALLAGGAVLYDGEATYDYRDGRIDAIVVISGPGRDAFGLTAESFQGLSLPMLVFAGSDDPGTAKEGGPEWRAEPYDFAPAGAAYRAFLDGANHVTYVGGLTGAAGPERGGFFRWSRNLKRAIFPEYGAKERRRDGIAAFTQEAVRVFWDAFLKDGAAAREALDTGAVTEGYEDFAGWSRK